MMRLPPVVHAELQAAVNDGVFPGAVLAVRLRGQAPCIAAAGRLSLDSTSPPAEVSTLYDLASLTKPLVTVSSILLLVQQAKLQLDDPIEGPLPELSGSVVGQSSIKDLLTHSSGLPGWRPLYERLYEKTEAKGRSPDCIEPAAARSAVLDLIRNEPLVYAKGARSLYSDLGFILLGILVERVAGVRLDEWYRSAVTDPLGDVPLLFAPLTGSDRHRGSSIKNAAGIAPTEYDTWRQRLLRGEVHDENAAALGGITGHAGLFGTAEGVLAVSGAWLSAYHGKDTIFSPDLVRRFVARQTNIPQSSWALGWDTPTKPSSSGRYFSECSFGHLGYTGTSLWVDPIRKHEVVILSNRVHPTRRNEKIREFRPRMHDLIMREFALSEEG
jgi:CubicO group peptidase (beta-lactamase class C family)